MAPFDYLTLCFVFVSIVPDRGRSSSTAVLEGCCGVKWYIIKINFFEL